jgi:hypothetical protein
MKLFILFTSFFYRKSSLFILFISDLLFTLKLLDLLVNEMEHDRMHFILLHTLIHYHS